VNPLRQLPTPAKDPQSISLAKRLKSEKFCKRLLGEKKFEHNKVSVEFQSVLVDPPRAGLDPQTLKLVSNYENIIYISCNPEAFRKNFCIELVKTHEIAGVAVFDQFAYTNHVECGFHLRKRSSLD